MQTCKHCGGAIKITTFLPFHAQRCAAEWAIAKARRPWYVVWR